MSVNLPDGETIATKAIPGKVETVGLGDFAVAVGLELRQNREIERFAVSMKR
ncbi:hypothetical protein [Mesorhizobium sp. WSM4906]|uniref:hypothetical protein n=1 Tax=Mesorhizobium sp. WSM4906 TaxID=3038546 RepID=UPI002415ACAA|nr:hypothetical protein [Mesorhizobium sp. WSM4906]WFP74807.1 hypothetical protein QAZ22_24185 [Mesorhizobium sp. WSM4906]